MAQGIAGRWLLAYSVARPLSGARADLPIDGARVLALSDFSETAISAVWVRSTVPSTQRL